MREGAPADSLDAWDRQLARVALAFEERRRAIVARLAASYRGFAAALAPDGGEFSISLVSQLDELAASAGAGDGREPEAASGPAAAGAPSADPPGGAFMAALRARRPGEIARAISGFGPHRDDLRFAEDAAATLPATPAESATGKAAGDAGAAGAWPATCGSSGRRANSAPRCSPCCSPSAPWPPR